MLRASYRPLLIGLVMCIHSSPAEDTAVSERPPQPLRILADARGFNIGAAGTTAKAGQGFGLTVELRDGSRFRAKSPAQTLGFRAPSFGELTLPIAGIRSVEFADDAATARLTMVNEDGFDGQFIAAALPLETGFGKTELPVKLIKNVRFFAAGKAGAVAAGLVALWSGEDNGRDSAGDNHATLSGNADFAEGKIGKAFRLDGRKSTVKIPQSPNLPPADQVTISFWMRADADNAMDTFQGLVTSDFCVVEISCGPGGKMGVNFGVSTTAKQQATGFFQGPGKILAAESVTHTSDVNGGGAPVSAGEWHHIAATYDGAKL